MIKAGSLIYAIIIALIIAIASSSFLLFQYFKIIESENDLLDSKLRLNAISAINYFLVTDNYVCPSDTKISLYNDLADSVSIHIEKWGILDLLTATASSGGKSFSKIALVGDLIDKKNTPVLYLADNNTALSLCGKTIIKGNCSLPKAGVKRAYIEGQNFIGSKLVDGDISLSNPSLPPIDINLLNFTNRFLNYTPSEGDSFIQFSSQMNAFSSFEKAESVIFSQGPIALRGNHYEGKIIIIRS